MVRYIPPATMRIFLVENHPDTLNCIHRHLQRAGHEVECAQTITEALRVLAAKSCDLLIADLNLPDGDGWTLLEHLGAARPTAAIAMSGNAASDVRARCNAAGFQEYLLKPFLPADLDLAITRAVNSVTR